MYVDFNELPENSRIWIYQADREFRLEEIELISAKAMLFIDQWTRHGDDLKGSFTIKYNQFLIIAVDEGFNNVSGCSIDASVRFVQELEKALSIDMMDKMNISFRSGEHINLVKMPQFKAFVKEDKINGDTIVFNNMIATKNELETAWEVPAKESWHQRFLV